MRTALLLAGWVLLALVASARPGGGDASTEVARELQADAERLAAELVALPPAERPARVHHALRAVGVDPATRIELEQAVLAALGPDAPGDVEATVRDFLWRDLHAAARFAEALEDADLWLAAAERGGWERQVADAWLGRGSTLLQLDRLEDAARNCERALALYEEAGDKKEEAEALTVLGLLAFRRGEYERATELHSRALYIGEELEHVGLQARAWSNLGLVYKKVGSHEEARDAFERSYDLATSDTGRLVALANLGNAYRELGELDTALDIHRRVLEDSLARGQPLLIAAGHQRVGKVLAMLGRDEEAEVELARSLELRYELGLASELAESMLELARVRMRLGRAPEAAALLEEAVGVLGDEPGLLERDLYAALAEAYREAGRYERSVEAYERFVELERRLTTADLTEKIAELSTRSQLAVREAEVDRLRAQQDLDRVALERERVRNVALVVVCVLLTALVVAVLVAARIRSRLTGRVEEERARLAEEQRRSQTLDSLSLLAAGVAHDFNNTLTAILGGLALARTSDDEAEVEELLSRAEGTAEEASALTRQLLDFARGSRPDLRPHALPALLDAWVEFVCAATSVEVALDVPADLWPAVCDQGQIAQVVRNLALNAVQAMDGEGTLVVDAQNVELAPGDPSGLAPGPYVSIVLADTGPGVSEDLRERIFEPYVTTKKRGRGLGLATSYAVLQRHAGLLRLRPDHAHGAAFELLLPARPGADVGDERELELTDGVLVPRATHARKNPAGLTAPVGMHEVGAERGPKERHDPERPPR